MTNKHLDPPGSCDCPTAQERVLYLIEVLDGHIDTLMSNDGVKQAIANAMKKGH